MKKLLVVLVVVALMFSFAACGASDTEDTTAAVETEGDDTAAAADEVKGYVGISMPTQSSERWIGDGNNMKDVLEAAGYTVDLQYAEDDINAQKSQIENMITKGADVLVIAAVDASTLSATLDQAGEEGVKIIAYDRLLVNTGAVSYYATFDNFLVGVQQANSLVAGLEERFPDVSPWNVELFAGSPDDTNSAYFFNGAMSVLQPMIDAGEVVVPSGQTSQDQVGTLRWDGAVAQSRMDAIIAANYSDGSTVVHGVLSPYDGLSRGIISSLVSAGYTVESGEFPIVSGQDAEVASVKLMMTGEQYATIFKDTRTLAAVAAGMVEAVLSGNEPEINDQETYDNGVKVVDSFLCEPLIVYEADIEELLVGSGYIDAADLE
ncbi:MAG: multiple monosaccharide ABC transporter substrate-binding protein [Eubacteriales bacterium]